MVEMQNDAHGERKALLDLSAQLGRDPLFVQATTGNTSIKIGDTLWIKASGTWLVEADRMDNLVPINLPYALDCIFNDQDPTRPSINPGDKFRASIETAMHAVLPQRIVIHIHSVNVIAWAVRADGPKQLAPVLDGMRWRWIPYVDSGVALAHAVNSHSSQEADVFILGNHGLIVCGNTCKSVETTLREVDQRLATEPADCADPDYDCLREIADSGPWWLPEDIALHSLGFGLHNRSLLAGEILYPCQAIFWQTRNPTLFTAVPASRVTHRMDPDILSRPFLIIEECGVLLGKGISPADYAILHGLAHVVQRIPARSVIRYLTEQELASLNPDCSGYRALSQKCSVFSQQGTPVN